MVFKTLTSFPKGKHCQLCLTAKIDPEALGNICQTANVIVHYFCLLLASQIQQKGTDQQGLLGFFSRDIKKEIKRGSTLACSYCKKKGATVACSGEHCHMNFHVPCAQENGSLHQYFSEFKSFCEKHKPRQKLPAGLNRRRNLECVLCCTRIIFSGKSYKDDPLWPTCCKPQALLHKRCLQHFATSSGYYFKCPFCNNKTDFFNGMKIFGIYIPEQEASWETEPNAYRELLERNVACVARTCMCHRGRNYAIRNSKWHIELCSLCGASGQHRGCFSEPITPGTFECSVCSKVNARYSGSAPLSEPEDEPEPSPICEEEVITEAVLQPVQENISKNTSMDCEEIVVISDSDSEDVNLEGIDDGTPALKNIRKRQLPTRQEKRFQRKRQRLAECGAETSSQVCLIDEEENGSQMLCENDSSSLTTNTSTNHQQACEIYPQSAAIIVEQPSSPIVIDDNESALFIAKVCTLSDCNQTEINEIMGCGEVSREQVHGDQGNIKYINLVSDDEDEVLVISDTDAESSASSLLDSEGSLLDLSEIPESEKTILFDYFSCHDADDRSEKPKKPRRKRKKRKRFTHTKKRKSVCSSSNNKGKSNKRSIETFNDKLVNKSPSPMKDSPSCLDTPNINDSSLSHSSISQIVIPKEKPIRVSCTKETVPLATTNNKSLDGVASSIKNKKLIQSNDNNATVNKGSEINSVILSKQNKNNTERFCNSKDFDVISTINESESLNKDESIETNPGISSCKNIQTDVCSKVNNFETIIHTAEVHLVPNEYEIDNNPSLSKNLELPKGENSTKSLWCDSNFTVGESPPYGTLFSDDSAVPMISAGEETVDTNESVISDTTPVELFQTDGNDKEVINTMDICDDMALDDNLRIGPDKVMKVYRGKKNVESILKRRNESSSRIDNTKILNTVSGSVKKISSNSTEKLKILCSIPLEQPIGKIIHSIINMNDQQRHLAPGGSSSEVTISPLAEKDSSSNSIVDCPDYTKIQLPTVVSVSNKVESDPSKHIAAEGTLESQPLKFVPLETQVVLQSSKGSPLQVQEENSAGVQMGSELLKFSPEFHIKSQCKLTSVEVQVELQPDKQCPLEMQVDLQLPKLFPPEVRAEDRMVLQSSKLNFRENQVKLPSSKPIPVEDEVGLLSCTPIPAEEGVELQSSKLNVLDSHSSNLNSSEKEGESLSSKVNLPKSRLSRKLSKRNTAKKEGESESSKVNVPKSRLSLEAYKLRTAKNQAKLQSSNKISSAEESVKLQSSELSLLDSQPSKLNFVETQVSSKSSQLCSAENEVYLQLSQEPSVVSKLQSSEVNPSEVTFSSPRVKHKDQLSHECSPKVLELNTPKDLLKTKLLSQFSDDLPNENFQNILSSNKDGELKISSCGEKKNNVLVDFKNNFNESDRFNDSECNANEVVNDISDNKDNERSLNNDHCCAIPSNCQEIIPNWYNICKIDCATCQNSTVLIEKQLDQDSSTNGHDFPSCANENRININNKSNTYDSVISFSPKSQNDFSVNYSSVIEQHSNITFSKDLNDSQIIEMGTSDCVQSGYNSSPLRKSSSKNFLVGEIDANCFSNEKKYKSVMKESSIDLSQTNTLESCTQKDKTASETEMLVCNLPDIVLSAEIRSAKSNPIEPNSIPNFLLCNSSATNKENKLSQNPVQQFNQSEIIENSEISNTILSKDQSTLEYNNNWDSLSKNIKKVAETSEHYIDRKRQLNSLNEIESQSKNESEKEKKQFVNCLNISTGSKRNHDSLISKSTNIITHDLMPCNKNFLGHEKHTSQIVDINTETNDAVENLSESLNTRTPRKPCDQKLFSRRDKHRKSRRLYSYSKEVFKVRVTYQQINGNDEKPPLVSEIETLYVLNAPIFRQQLMERFFFENEKKLVIYTDASGFQYVRLFVENIPQSIDCRIIFESEGNMSTYLKELIEYHRAVDVVTPQVVLIICCNATLHDKDIFKFLQLASKLNNIKLVVTTLLSEKTRVLKFNRKLIYYSQRYGYYVWDITKITFQIDSFRR